MLTDSYGKLYHPSCKIIHEEDDRGNEYTHRAIEPIEDFIKIFIKDTVDVYWERGELYWEFSKYQWSDVPKQDLRDYPPYSYWRTFKYDLPVRDDYDIVDDVLDVAYKNDPLEPGFYQVEAEVTLVYDIDNMIKYMNKDGSIDEADIEKANIVLNLKKSSIKILMSKKQTLY